MSIENGQTANADDFITKAQQNATPSNDSAKVPQLESDGRMSQSFLEQAFGDGSHGSATLDGSTDYNTFSSRSGSTYTLTKDVYAQDLTINTGVTLVTNGWRIFVKGTLSGAGKIQWNGANGSNGTDGADVGSSGSIGGGGGGSAVTGYFSNNAGTSGGSASGQSSGGAGGDASTIRSCLGIAGGAGGAGGTHSGDTGGIGTTTGGNGGTLATRVEPVNKYGIFKTFTLMGLDIRSETNVYASDSKSETNGGDDDFGSHFHSTSITADIIAKINTSGGGTGGGAGGGSNASSHDQTGGSGGGGGASGGLIFIIARIWAGTFTIEAKGGNGGNGGNGSVVFNDSAGGGGGGGGGGGVVITIYERKTWTGSYTLTGGSAGTGGAQGGQGGATAAGSNGSAGSTGSSYEYYIGNLI